MDDQSLEHTRWNCKYHIVFAPKFRRKIIYGKYKKEIGVILRKLCEYKHLEILEAHACIDHIHMCIKIPPKYSVAQIMGYLKGKSALMIFEQFSNLKRSGFTSLDQSTAKLRWTVSLVMPPI